MLKMKNEVRAIKDKVCDTLYEKVIDEKRLVDALDIINDSLEEIEYADGNTGVYLDSEIVKEINSLDPGSFESTAQYDYEASKLLYKAISFDEDVKKKVQMSDKRLWYEITFNHLSEYVTKRWGEESEEDEARTRVERRLFLSGTMTSGKLIRQAVSRIWWYAYLTVDEKNEEDEWHLLNILCENTDVQLSLTDRTLAYNQNVLKAVLRFLEIPENKSLRSGKNIKLISRWLIGYSGVMELPLLSDDQLNEILVKVKKRIG